MPAESKAGAHDERVETEHPRGSVELPELELELKLFVRHVSAILEHA